MSSYKIIDGFLFKDGQQVPYKASPNVGKKCTPEILICHDTASPLDASGPISWLTNPQAQASAHFVVARNGAITQLVSTDRTAWHAGKSVYNGKNVAGSVNSFAIGIEIVNPGIMTDTDKGKAFFSNGKKNVGWDMKEYGIEKAAPLPLSLKRPEAYWMSYTDEQLEAVLAIGRAVKERYNIKDVVAHWTVAPGRKVDTNPLFPLDEMKDAILKGTDLMGKTTKATKTTTVTVKNNATQAEKDAAAKSAAAKTAGENTVVKVVEPAATSKGNTDVSPPKPIAGTPNDSKEASKVAPTDMDTVDPSVAPIMVPHDPTPVAPPQLTPSEIEINKSRAKDEDKQEQIEALDQGLVTQDLNLRNWPDGAQVIAVIAVGAKIDIVRESKSQVTGSTWYKVRVTKEAMRNYVGKEKVLEGFVHSAYVQRQ